MKTELFSLWRRIVGRRTVFGPGPSAAELNFLRLMEEEGGFLPDGDERLDGWWDELSGATRRGLVTWGSGWNATIRLTEAGWLAVRAAPWRLDLVGRGGAAATGWSVAMTAADEQQGSHGRRGY